MILASDEATADFDLAYDNEGGATQLTGRERIYLMGRITYSDIFKRSHVTAFCLLGYGQGIAAVCGEEGYNYHT
jgi:hypothetical protein